MIRQPNDRSTDAMLSRKIWIFSGVVAVLSVLSSGYFAVTGLVNPGALVPGGSTDAARTFAAYMSARSIVLLGAVIWLLAVQASRPLGLLLALNGAVQLVDAAIGTAHHQVAQTVGPMCFAIGLLVAARLLGGLTLRPGRPSRATEAQVQA